jgi:hypothetical protein
MMALDSFQRDLYMATQLHRIIALYNLFPLAQGHLILYNHPVKETEWGVKGM